MTRPEGERIAALEAIMVRVETKLDKQEERISVIEDAVTSFKGGWWLIGGIIATASTVGGFVLNWLGFFRG